MNTQVLLFLGKAALLTVAFVVMYRLLLRRETFHGLKRGALMLSLVLSYVLPLTVITVHRDVRKSPAVQTVKAEQPVAAIPMNQSQPIFPVAEAAAPVPTLTATENAAVQVSAQRDITDILLTGLLAAYLAGLIVMLTLRIISILKVAAIVKSGKTVERGNGYRIVVTDKNVSPFSWLGTIVLREKDYAGIDTNVLRHEKAHIAHGHPSELMLVDFMSLFQWFNPAVWVLRRDLCLVHEQQADADVLKSVSDARPYQYLLLTQSQSGLAFNIVACFNGNGVESRIDMMNRKKSAKRQVLRFLYIPVLMCLSMALTANVIYDMNATSESADEWEEPVYGDQLNPVFSVDGLWYYIENGGAVLCRQVENGVVKYPDYNGPDEFVVPSSIEYQGKTWPVTKIGERCMGFFKQYDKITRIVVPSSVTEIGTLAFDGLPALESIYIPKSVVKIGENLLGKDINNPARIEIDPSNPVYDSRENCNAIIETATNTLIVGCQGTVIPSSVTSIGDNAFRTCKKLESIVIPEGVKRIGKSAFEGCSGLISISMPASLESIGDGAFESCSGLSSITIPAGLESIGSAAFFNCTGLRSIKVAQGNRVFDSREDCNAIVNTRAGELILACASTIIPQGIKKIGYRAFYHCRLSNGLVLPEGIEEIADEAFAGCTGYSEIVLPASLKSLGKDVFGELKYDMQSITGAWQAFQERNQNNKPTFTSIKVNPANKYFDSREDCNALIRTKDNTLLLACDNSFIPQSVKAIGDGAFKGLKGNKEIVLPKGLEYVGEEAFANYVSVAPLSLPSTVKFIGASAFVECKMAPDLVVSGKVKEIGDHAFEYSEGIKTISIGKGVKHIGNGAFQGLENVETVVIPDGVEKIGNFCFGSCSNLTSVSLPTSLKEIGTGAFQNIGLKEIKIPSGVKVIGPMTFTGCMSLVKVTLPKTLKRIEMGAFRGCPMLEQIHLPEGLEYIGDRAFENCRKITEAFIPAGVKEIGKAPYDTRNITSIRVDSRNSRYESPQGSNVLIDKTTETLIMGCNNSIIPAGIKEIGYAAFDGCSQLENIVIPDGVERIGDYAFRYCDAYITIPASVKEIGESSFLMTNPSKVTNNSGLAINHGQRSERQMIIAPSPEEIERMRQLINGAQ